MLASFKYFQAMSDKFKQAPVRTTEYVVAKSFWVGSKRLS